MPHVCLCVHESITVCLCLYRQTFEPLTFLCQRSVRFIFVHEHLDLFWFERGVEYLIQTRVSLFIVNKLCHLLHGEVWTTLCTPVNRREAREEIK